MNIWEKGFTYLHLYHLTIVTGTFVLKSLEKQNIPSSYFAFLANLPSPVGRPVVDPVCVRPSMSWAHGTRYQDGGLEGLEIVSYFVDYRLFTPLSKPLDGVLLNIFVIKCFREISVPFCTETEAQIACNSLSVDPEPKRGGVKKELVVKGNVLQAWVFPCLIKIWCDSLFPVKSRLCPIWWLWLIW